MLRKPMTNRARSPLFETDLATDGHMWMEFLGRLLVVLGIIAPPLTILAVVAYYATHPMTQ
jgi:hypothetical protein